MNIKKQKVPILITVVGIVFMLIGTSYSMYNFILKGQKENVIELGKLTFTYKESENGFDILSYELLSDEAGKTQSEYYEFEIKGTSGVKDTINYLISLEKILDENNFSDSDVKIYLTKVENNNEVEVFEPTLVSDFNDKEESANVKKIYSDKFRFDGVDMSEQKHIYRLRLWLKSDFDLSSLLNRTDTNGEQNIKLTSYSYKFKVNIESGATLNLDESGANVPELATNMIPVYYDGETWRKADSTNNDENYKWYDYNNKMWANAVTVTNTNRDTYVDAQPGETIAESDINTMWVWIPRFKVNTTNFETIRGTESETVGECSCAGYDRESTCETAGCSWTTQTFYFAPNAIDVSFVSLNSNAHDAFTLGTQNLSGFWYGKFESSATSIPTEESQTVRTIVIIPNVKSWRYAQLSVYHTATKNMALTDNVYGLIDEEVDPHVNKNNEWGAVAYLTQSIYGRCTSSTSCTEIGTNTGTTYVTGRGNSEDYNTTGGMNASTTGNIYGVYDMSGGSYEYVMGVFSNAENGIYSGYSNTTSFNSGFNGYLTSEKNQKTNGIALPDSKYYNVYTTEADYTSAGLQHALVETAGWYGDDYAFVSSSGPWFRRGKSSSDETANSGIFTYLQTFKSISSPGQYGFRVTLTNK